MALAAIRQVAAEFAASCPDHPGVVVLPSLGTAGGISAVAAGAIDLALAARPLAEAERGKGLCDRRYARTPMAFVTHHETNATNICLADVERILVGELMTWPDGSPLRLVRREPSDADWAMFRAMSPGMDRAVTVALQRPGLLTVTTDQTNAAALERLRGSFGAMSIGQLLAERLSLKPLLLDGVAPTVANMVRGAYLPSRSLYVVGGTEPDAAVARFLSFLAGADARAVLSRLGHVPEG